MQDLISTLPLAIPTLASALDRSPDCVKLLDLEGRLLWMNSNGLCAMEIDNFDSVRLRDWQGLWPEANAGAIKASMDRAVQEGVATFTGYCPTAKGTKRWWDVTVHPAANEQGETIGFLSISRDVTERENQVAALETVVAEMRHRLRNSYTIVCGLIRGLARGDSGLTEFSVELQRRITAIADAQSLFVTGNSQTQLKVLVELLIEPFRGHDGVEVDLDVEEDVLIDARVSDAIALTVGELVVNSAKHGAIAKGGRIDVSGRMADGTLTLIWRERATGAVSATSRDGGQGLKIIRQMLHANSATLDLTWGPQGPIATVAFQKGISTDPAGAFA